MLYKVSDFVFQPPHGMIGARRVLLKPNAAYPRRHPVTTSAGTLRAVIDGIRRVSDADIILLEASASGEPVRSIYRALGYDFPRVLRLDVRDCNAVEVENPLPKAFALPTIWVPNIILSCDYLVSVASFKVLAQGGSFSIKNLVSLLPPHKYSTPTETLEEFILRLGVQNIAADLYFTLPFDLGVVDARMKFFGEDDPVHGRIEHGGQILIGEPYEVDKEASALANVSTPYVSLIQAARSALEVERK